MTTHLAQSVTTLARMWKLVRQDGTSFYFTTHDRALTFDGQVYKSLTGFQTTAIASSSDMGVDNLNVTGVFDDASITLSDLRAGLFDYADIYVFVVNWMNLSQGAINLRRGKLGECVSSPQGFFQTELRGMTQQLQQKIGDIYGPLCRADLFDAKCKLVSADYQCTATITAVSNRKIFTVTLNTTPSGAFFGANDGWFQYGMLQFTSGLNEGLGTEIKTWDHTGGVLGLYLSTGYPMTIGDTLNMWPGCDKSLDACKTKFNNLLNKRSEDYLPGTDQLYFYPNAAG